MGVSVDWSHLLLVRRRQACLAPGGEGHLRAGPAVGAHVGVGVWPLTAVHGGAGESWRSCMAKFGECSPCSPVVFGHHWAPLATTGTLLPSAVIFVEK